MAKKIVLTGGPCGGKTASLPFLKRELEREGFAVFVVPEAATLLLNAGVRLSPTSGNGQQSVLHLMLTLEAMMENAAEPYGDKAVILCDRGLLDAAAYQTREGFAKRIAAEHLTVTQARDRYDGVFHMVTAARGAEAAYTTDNNTVRTETPEQARRLDDKTLAGWIGHPHVRILDNRGDFADKQQRLLAEVNALLGYPEPREIERRFLIRRPSDAQISALPLCKGEPISQTYCVRPDGTRFRLRARGTGDDCTYTFNEKERLTDCTRIERERRLTREEYENLLTFADPTRHAVVKERTCLVYDGTYFELDRFPFWERQAILEVELLSEDAPVSLPPCFEVIREITGERAYNNSALAKAVPAEE